MTESTKTTDPKSAFSRRAFLQGSSAVAAATALQQQAAEATENTGAAVVSGEQAITLNVNGEDRKVTIEPRATLLEVLRYNLDLTGAKPVSLDGSSGASTILIDGKPVAASTTLAMQAVGKKIETVESLAGDAIPKAFVKHDASQCGFCTPGFVVAVRALLNKNPQASSDDIRKGLNGNICRCGTYDNIVDAVVDVVKGGD